MSAAPFIQARATGSHRERDDGYRGTLARLADRWRVIVCADALQWAVQRRDAGSHHGAAWRGVSFHREKASLIAASVRLAERCDPDALARLALLPLWFGGGHG